MEYIIEAAVVIFSSAGAAGVVIAAILNTALKKARQNAEAIRNERIETELLQCRFREAATALLLSLTRYCVNGGTKEEVFAAEAGYKKICARIREHERQMSLKARIK